MDSMTMPFDLSDGLAEDLKTREIRAGDKIRFDLDVDWTRAATGLVTAAEKLPPETELTLGG